jgi:mono/diheme cytochrome c family protein
MIRPTKDKTVFVAMLAIAALFNMGIASADEASIEEGRHVFQTVAGIGCKTCHGDYGEGDLGVGPYIRGATEGAIRAAIAGINEMIVVENMITEEDIVAVIAYLQHLGTLQVGRTLSKRGRFLPDTVETRPGSALQLVIKNSGVAAATYESDNMGIDAWTISGRSTSDIEWQAPDTIGEYTIYCSDCKLKDQFFVIKVHADAPPPPGFVPIDAQSASNSN